MKRLRVSYSLLDAWSRGQPDLAIDTYFHISKPRSAAMEYGIKFHEDMAEHIDKYSQFPRGVLWYGTDDSRGGEEGCYTVQRAV